MASYTGGGGHVAPGGQSAPSPHWPRPGWSAVPRACPAANFAGAAGVGGASAQARGERRRRPGKGGAGALDTSSLDRYCGRKAEEGEGCGGQVPGGLAGWTWKRLGGRSAFALRGLHLLEGQAILAPYS